MLATTLLLLLGMGAVTGRVVDATGAPAAGAVVHLVRWTGESFPGANDPLGTVTPVGDARADAEGRFRCAVDDGLVVGVWAEQGEGAASLPVAPLLAGDAVELRLLPTVVLRGQVRLQTPAGAVPAVGAELQGTIVPVCSRDPGAAPQPHSRRRFEFRARTDARGAFALRAFTTPEATPQGPGFTVQLGGAYHHLEQPSAVLANDVLLLSPPRQHLRLVDAQTGAPVAGVVAAQPYDPRVRGVSDAQGRIEVDVAAGPGIALFPREHEWVGPASGLWAPTTSAAPTLALVRGARVAVRLLRPDRSPIAGARVAVVGSLAAGGGHRALDAVAATDAEGRLALGLPSGAVAACVELDRGWVPLFDTGGTWPVPRGDLVLDPCARLAGRVQDQGGTPLDQARVLLLPEGLSDTGWISFRAAVRQVPVDKTGRFLAAGLLPGRVRVAVMAPGFLPWFGTWTAAADAVSATVVLTPGARLTGQVVDAAGEPVAGAQVRVVLPDPDGNRSRFDLDVPMGRMTGFGPPERSARADDRGEFTLTELPPGIDLEVEARTLDPATRKLLSGAATARAGSRVELAVRPGMVRRKQG